MWCSMIDSGCRKDSWLYSRIVVYNDRKWIYSMMVDDVVFYDR